MKSVGAAITMNVKAPFFLSFDDSKAGNQLVALTDQVRGRLTLPVDAQTWFTTQIPDQVKAEL